MVRNNAIRAAACAAALCLASCQSIVSGVQGLSTQLQDAGISSSTVQGAATAVTTVAKAVEEMTPDQEYYIGRAVGAKIFSQYKAYDVPNLNAYLNKLGRALALYADPVTLYDGFHFMAMDSMEINAFATPSGLILVSRGLLACASSEDELAAILAHEIAHVTQKHGIKAIKSARVVEALKVVGSMAGEQLAGANLAKVTAAFGDTIGDITGELVESGYSKTQEFDSDARAVATLKAAGYDPEALKRVLETMKGKLAGASKGFSKTHPTPEARLAALKLGAKAAVSPNAARDARFAAAMKYR